MVSARDQPCRAWLIYCALFWSCVLVKSDHHSFLTSAVESRAVLAPENLVNGAPEDRPSRNSSCVPVISANLTSKENIRWSRLISLLPSKRARSTYESH